MRSFSKTGSGQTHDGKVEKRDAFFAGTLTAGPSDAAANRKPGVICCDKLYNYRYKSFNYRYKSLYNLSQIVIVFESWREDGTQSEHLCTFDFLGGFVRACTIPRPLVYFFCFFIW
jgi:hypothetical protein